METKEQLPNSPDTRAVENHTSDADPAIPEEKSQTGVATRYPESETAAEDAAVRAGALPTPVVPQTDPLAGSGTLPDPTEVHKSDTTQSAMNGGQDRYQTGLRLGVPIARLKERVISTKYLQALVFLIYLFAFLACIDLMSLAFKALGGGFAAGLLGVVSDPVAGVLIGLLVTSIVQSSSFTTSLTVGLVAAGTIPLNLAVPIVMGANIGTTVTNTIVSLGHVANRKEFERAFAASTVHDFFNILAVTVLFPLEMLLHPIERIARILETVFAGAGGIQMISPLKMVIRPVTSGLAALVPWTWLLLVIAIVVLFVSLSQMVRLMRRAVVSRVEGLFDRVLFRNDRAGFLFGWVLTSIVQSSSVTTSLIVPLVGTGMLSVRRIFPYTLGANLGTTITAILASFAIGKPEALMVAFAHLVFNVLGTVIFYPAKALPIALANRIGRVAARSKKSTMTVVSIYFLVYLAPILYLLNLLR